MNKRNKSGLTLVELVIAITISVIIMFFIGNFIANSLAEIAESNVESRFQADFVDFNATMNNYRNVFLTGSILVDNTGTGSDILMLTSIDKSAGIIF
jgi:prepilin-type N-terminal cleavage/methylation domain-containing protein